MNPLLKNTIDVQGLDKALKIARDLIEADYQVMIQLDDCDVYVISYNYNDLDLGGEIFVSLPQEKVEEILDAEDEKVAEKKQDNKQIDDKPKEYHDPYYDKYYDEDGCFDDIKFAEDHEDEEPDITLYDDDGLDADEKD